MKTHLWVWLCTGLAAGIVALVGLGGFVSRALPLPARAPWPATTTPATPPAATARAPQAEAGVALPTPGAVPTLSGQLNVLAPQIRVEAAAWQNGVLAISFTVQTAPGDCLFEPPVLKLSDTQIPVSATSLKTARMALLSLAAGGAARASLSFEEAPASGSGTLVFNPGSTTDSLVAPRLDIAVAWPLTPTVAATGTPRKP